MPPRKKATTRPALTRHRITDAALTLADTHGLSSVTMRAVASAVGVEAMSLYNHITNRADLLNAMVDALFARIDLSDTGQWRTDLSTIAQSTYDTLHRHPWAIGMLDSRRTPGPATLHHHNHALGILRTAGFTPTGAVHALAVVDSFVYGAVIQARSLPFQGADAHEEAAQTLLTHLSASQYPHLAEIAAERAQTGSVHPDADDEFHFGLTLIIDALTPDGP